MLRCAQESLDIGHSAALEHAIINGSPACEVSVRKCEG